MATDRFVAVSSSLQRLQGIDQGRYAGVDIRVDFIRHIQWRPERPQHEASLRVHHGKVQKRQIGKSWT